MRKWKVFWDFAAEEAFLDEMARRGQILKEYSALGVYHFVQGTPQERNYKIDYRLFSTKAEFENYLSIFEDAGWQHVCGTKQSGSQYFLPASAQAGADIFSDRASAAERYKALYRMCLLNMIVFVAYLVVECITTGGNLSSLGFLTPGLWQRTGIAFWRGFLFELPFVVLRVGFPILFAWLACLYGYWAEKAHEAYQKQKKEEAAQ